MVKVHVEINGHIELDLADLYVEYIAFNGDLKREDMRNYTVEQLQEAIDEGELYINLEKSLKRALDGNISLKLKKEDEE